MITYLKIKSTIINTKNKILIKIITITKFFSAFSFHNSIISSLCNRINKNKKEILSIAALFVLGNNTAIVDINNMLEIINAILLLTNKFIIIHNLK